MFSPAPELIALRPILIEQGDQPNVFIIRLDGKWYQWSKLRETLDRLGD